MSPMLAKPLRLTESRSVGHDAVGVVSIFNYTLRLRRRLQPCGVPEMQSEDRIRVNVNYESIHQLPASRFSSGLRANIARGHPRLTRSAAGPPRDLPRSRAQGVRGQPVWRLDDAQYTASHDA